ncbi:hypothetical protein TREMEDRAFT_62032 [Tremella mesenterica DSM 1558]|uniref:uncharacterized protein n=1 Tax=Tremella mesenterica (strain ATCC 24925 / CBS 8224 / DSM 1558 / NBRC 9311 / NRRL Y-6157 / RJB 2259-6 / UBC 559-6) TaxID=578456 RepID=UPI0003F48FFE|nr:uncharacterized protein TREMEDRAFT_62032 [Tremella mesenterica DSM 1558]EIW70271.1 hypothetical protein TREMEDRAFT_62032 [Tremella mesenterica DSM 1558]
MFYWQPAFFSDGTTRPASHFPPLDISPPGTLPIPPSSTVRPSFSELTTQGDPTTSSKHPSENEIPNQAVPMTISSNTNQISKETSEKTETGNVEMKEGRSAWPYGICDGVLPPDGMMSVNLLTPSENSIFGKVSQSASATTSSKKQDGNQSFLESCDDVTVAGPSVDGETAQASSTIEVAVQDGPKGYRVDYGFNANGDGKWLGYSSAMQLGGLSKAKGGDGDFSQRQPEVIISHGSFSGGAGEEGGIGMMLGNDDVSASKGKGKGNESLEVPEEGVGGVTVPEVGGDSGSGARVDWPDWVEGGDSKWTLECCLS